MAGTKNSGRRQEKPFADALRMEIAAAGEDHKKLRAIARKLLDKAEDGELQAIAMLADRLDGRPRQQMDLEHACGVAVILTSSDQDLRVGGQPEHRPRRPPQQA
jgi:hypothetical protein